MDEIIGEVATFITQHREWAGPIILGLAFGESLVIVGMLIPATALMVAVGGMIGAGLLEPIPMFLWAVVGAVLGDWVSFALGRRIGRAALRRPPLDRYRTAIAKARLIFRRYGVLSILLGRFLGPVRATVPLVAGIMGMRTRTFQCANVASALLWVPALFAPGYLATTSVGEAVLLTRAQLAIMAAVVAIVTIFGIIASLLLLRPRRSAVQPVARTNRVVS